MGSPSKELTRTERTQLTECIKTLSAVSEATPELRLSLLAEGCGQALGFDKLMVADASSKMQRLVETTDFFCNEESGSAYLGAAPSMKMSVLVHDCGAEYYGLTQDNKQHMSIDWFLGQRTAAWIADVRSRADTDLVTTLDGLMGDFKAPLPIPATAEGLYSLPQAHHLDLALSPAYVLITKDEVKAITRPGLLLTERGAVLLDELATAKAIPINQLAMELASFGDGSEELERLIEQPVEEPALESGRMGSKMALAEGKMGKADSSGSTGRFSMKKDNVDPELAKRQAIDQARKAGIFGTLSQSDVAVSTPAENAPLLIADKAMPAARVLEVADTLRERGAYLGTQQGNRTLRAGMPFGSVSHPNAVVVGDLGAQVTFKDDGLEVRMKGQKAFVPRISDEYDLQGLEDLLKASDLEAKTLLVSATSNTATYQDLVNVFDVALDAGLNRATTGIGGAVAFGITPNGTVGEGDGSHGIGSLRTDGRPPLVRTGAATATGDLDKNIIRRYIRRKLSHIRHCYERELLVSPTLEGKVVATFTIDSQGIVIDAKTEGMNEKVCTCITEAVKTIQFPKPKGGVVNVSYPFVFKTAE